jgi:polysaccharide biosynthesis/export protein
MVNPVSFPKIRDSAIGFLCLSLAALPFCPASLAQESTQTPAKIQENPLISPAFPAATTTNIPQFDQNSYLLGPGDEIGLELFGQPDISKTYEVLIDGTVSLPLVGNFFVRGLTLKQASDAIAAQYLVYFKRPILTARLIASRPVSVGISGEVTRPGTYISPTDKFPKLSLAIQTAGGITSQADIRNVQVRRPQSRGKDEIINVDLWKILKDGDLTQDVSLRDGDSIFIPTAKSVSPAQATQLAGTTFAPATISVNVVGEVRSGGIKQLKPNTPLNTAILAAGGFVPTRADPNSVRLIRLNPDGTVSDRKFKVNLAQGISTDTNPILQNNDIVIINRSGLAGFSDTVGTLLSPFNSITGTFFRFIPGGFGF